MSAQIAALQTEPIKYIALLDGNGEEYSDQFKVALYANVLILLVDHNPSDSSPDIDRKRVKESADTQTRIRYHIQTEKGRDSIQSLYVLINKRDLWEQNPESIQAEFLASVSEVVAAWESSNLVTKVEVLRHSNFKPDDIAVLRNKLIAHIE